MSNAIRCIDQRFSFKNSGISCLALILKLNNPRTIILFAGVAGQWLVFFLISRKYRKTKASSETFSKAHLALERFQEWSRRSGSIQIWWSTTLLTATGILLLTIMVYYYTLCLELNRLDLSINMDGSSDTKLEPTIPHLVLAQHKSFYPGRASEDEIFWAGLNP